MEPKRGRRPPAGPGAVPLRAWSTLSARPAFVGLLVATTGFAMSVTPSLIPRHWLTQGLVSGIVTALGYALGVGASHLWRTLSVREPPGVVTRLGWAALTVAVPATAVVATVQGTRWQREHHRLLGLAPPSPWGYVAGTLLALLVVGLLVLVARAIRVAARWVAARLRRRLPPRVAGVLGGLIVAVLVVGVLDGIVIDGLFAAADESFRLADELTDDRVEPPTSPLRSGSPASLVAFDELGRQGRAFVAGLPADEAHTPPGESLGTEPIRVYAGLEAADSDAERAALVVAELERTGAFDRAVVAVMTATGTGWINPLAADALEHLWDGDTALAASQYSYLPSWLSFLVDAARGREAGAELFNAVHHRWATLPEEDRPLLLVFGESLGADGAEAAFSGIADIRNRTDGALLVGPPNFSEHWSTFTTRRDPGTPERLPIYDGGATVRFAARAEHLDRPDAPWYEPRVVYLQHASDPVVWWTPRLLLRRPDWLAEPRGEDVSDAMRWFPIVTFWQLSADLVAADLVPAGHGHNYGPLVIDAWAAVAAPEGWTRADTERLHEILWAGGDDHGPTAAAPPAATRVPAAGAPGRMGGARGPRRAGSGQVDNRPRSCRGPCRLPGRRRRRPAARTP